MSYDIGHEPSLEPPEYEVPHCPVCGQECEIIYKNRYGEVIGCDDCIESFDAWEVME